jgi:glucose-6-phosphate dehydrogenase assembly protein OpcA
MSAFHLIGNLGTPVAGNVAAIERELAALWAAAGQGQSGAVIRACSCNLLAIVQNRREAETFQPVLAKVSESHPSRSIIAYPELEPNPMRGNKSDMQAWIGAQCSVPFSGGPQVCCESITISAQGNAVQDLPNVLVSLLVPDLPVYLYWRSLKITDQETIGRMARFCNLLIVDSHQSREDPQNRLNLLQLLIDQPEGIAVRDLNWGRVTPWRDLIAQFFDSVAARKHLQKLEEVEIKRNLSAPGSIPTRTLLLTGWLASRLGWRRISAARAGDQWLSRWESGGNEIKVTFSGTEASPDQHPGINSVVLRTSGKAEFSVFVDSGSTCITAVSSVGDSRLVHSVPNKEEEEATLLSNELSQTGEDAAFKAALAQALELEKSFIAK